MSVKIRLKRVGRKGAPYYRLVVADSRSPRDGRIIEQVGRYQPLQPDDNLEVNEERALYWLGVGAQPSDTVKSLLRRLGIMRRFHENRFGPSVPPGMEKYHEKKPEGAIEAPAPAEAEEPPVEAPAPVEAEEPATETPEATAEVAEETTEAPAVEAPAVEAPAVEAPAAEAAAEAVTEAPAEATESTPEAEAPESPATPEAAAPSEDSESDQK